MTTTTNVFRNKLDIDQRRSLSLVNKNMHKRQRPTSTKQRQFEVEMAGQIIYQVVAVLVINFVQGITKPNIVLILSDDQDLQFTGMAPMTKTRRLIADEGATFSNAFVTTPVCCPSRASILTGKYVHNHGVRNNTKEGGCSGDEWTKFGERSTIATYLERNGYTNFFAGKYMNAYGEGRERWKHVPPGWHWWNGLVGNSIYFNYSLSINGTKLEKHDDKDDDYLTNVITWKAMEFLQQSDGKQPWFVMLCPPAPHSPFEPNVKYKNFFSNISLPKPPNFNVHSPDKHWLVRRTPNGLDSKTIRYIEQVNKNRWRTLLSVDDMVESVVSKLKQLNMYNQTYIIYASDNGYHLGEFCLPLDKRQLYEFDIRIPMLISGPKIAKGVKVDEIVLNIDLAPSILDLANVSQTKMDGKSFVGFLTNDELGGGDDGRRRKNFLIEYWGEANRGVSSECPFLKNLSECHVEEQCVCQDSLNNTYKCVREIVSAQKVRTNFVFCRFRDDERFVEAYDLIKDPWQLYNIVSLPRRLRQSKRRYYERRLLKLSKCRSKFCH